MSGLEIDSVSKSFDGQTVLQNISLKIVAGSTHVLLGSSGSGKSTLLKIILGMTSADSGTLSLGGRPLAFSERTKWLHQIGYVPQEGRLFPHLTGEENVTLVAQTMNWDPTRRQKRIKELIDLVSLDPELLTRYPHQMSGGQRQRLAIMRALFLDPQLILLDEPLAALDPIVRADIQYRLREIFTHLRNTVLLVTHDISEAVYLGDDITMLRAGRVLQTGKIATFVSSPANPYVTQFLNAQRSWEASLK